MDIPEEIEQHFLADDIYPGEAFIWETGIW